MICRHCHQYLAWHDGDGWVSREGSTLRPVCWVGGRYRAHEPW